MKTASDVEITAAHVPHKIHIDAANPANEWNSADPIRFSTDWQGKNPDPALETEVRVLWSPETLYLQFVCHYREISVFNDSDPNGRRDHLWDRDVAEAFLQPPDSISSTAHVAPAVHVRGGQQSSPENVSTWERAASPVQRSATPQPADAQNSLKFYKEFEIAPNGTWIDLDITPSGLEDLRSGLARSVYLDEKKKLWTAELAIPMKSLTAKFNPHETWRVNFYRVEGKTEPRHYLAWQPTMTTQPNFHVPERFGTMRFK